MSDELKPWTMIQPEGQPYINGAVYAAGKRLCVCETRHQARKVCDSHNSAVRAAVKERGKDTKRLDWLEKHSPISTVTARYLGKDETLREAIDAALRAQSGDKSCT